MLTSSASDSCQFVKVSGSPLRANAGDVVGGPSIKIDTSFFKAVRILIEIHTLCKPGVTEAGPRSEENLNILASQLSTAVSVKAPQ